MGWLREQADVIRRESRWALLTTYGHGLVREDTGSFAGGSLRKRPGATEIPLIPGYLSGPVPFAGYG